MSIPSPPPADSLCSLPAARLAEGVRAGRLDVEELVDAFLQRIAQTEPGVAAWAWHQAQAVRSQLQGLPRMEPGRALPLLGVPVGVKDIFDTADMPTAYGSTIYRGHQPLQDAEAVARLRRAGALIMGKTVTTEFAYAHPGPTVNPHNPRHTPGGSSSGSAAAVADFMVPLALGSQTGGSTIRPAAYCGVVGFKPSFDAISTQGMKALSPSMDTVGIMGRCMEDIALAYSVLAQGAAPGAPRPASTGGLAARLCWYPGPDAAQADDDAWRALHGARQMLLDAGVPVGNVALSDAFGRLSEANRCIMRFEAVRSLDNEFTRHSEGLSAMTAELIAAGRRTDEPQYREARALVAGCARELSKALRETDVLMSFSTPGTAPLLATGTGNSVFNRGWTAMGAPSLTLPFGAGAESGLPLGVQFVAAPGCDALLLALGAQLERLFAAGPH
ncbi:amidase [Candidimonas nitroreducens]|nr:amidase [Candidimonas nitroreducens]